MAPYSAAVILAQESTPTDLIVCRIVCLLSSRLFY
jgi:hypothetical protein